MEEQNPPKQGSCNVRPVFYLYESKLVVINNLDRVLHEARRATRTDVRLGTINLPNEAELTQGYNVVQDALEDMGYDPWPDHIPVYTGQGVPFSTYFPDSCIEAFRVAPWRQPITRESTELIMLLEKDFNQTRVSLAEADEHTIRIWWTGQLIDFESELPQILLGETYGQPTHVRAVILAGEAPTAEFDDLRAKITKAVPALAGQFKESPGGPKYVGAIGAACLARQAELHPEELRFPVCDLRIPDIDIHPERYCGAPFMLPDLGCRQIALRGESEAAGLVAQET